ncbi:fibrinogen-like YCDxxxxGGGW domain-containing protein [Rothia sp. CCM 9416]|uniref:fibrinogen-like YCDxxxxGGGW domain-containing protein n=1 Tax=Rothia sp. CCM 9416 TaxID=3402655 RepID=UPI003AEACF14
MKKPSLITKISVGALALGLGVSLLPGATATNDFAPNGLSSETAAASCWEVKQNDPTAKSGTYWLYTPSMDAPEKFYCDQETDGGGWVLIGRGREGWAEDYYGRGDASELYTQPEGSTAFTPVQLSSEKVDQLLNGQRVDSLQDGIRFRRAADMNGRSWQNTYAKRSQTEKWSWALRATANWSDIRFENPPFTSSNYSTPASLGSVGSWGSFNTLDFTTSKTYGWKNGFAYKAGVWGSSSATSYLWSPSYGTPPIAFTQVFIRPRITQNTAGFKAIGDSGLPAETNRQLPNSYTASMRWRTSEDSGTGVVSELNTRVQAIAQVGNTVFTGGDFKNVVSANGETVNQAFIAGYDVNTAELVRTFTPTFNGQIKSLAALPNNLLAVGGEFSRVNGKPANGFVILDPVTGQTDTSLDWDIENRLASGVPVVKTIEVHGDYVYIGGSFTHVKGANRLSYAYSRNAARFSLSDGTVDISWRPATNGTVNGISASDDGVALAGYFTTVSGQPSRKLAYLKTTEGTLAKSWNWALSHRADNPYPSDGFQFDVQDVGDSIWAGGAEHLIAQYDKSDLSRRSSSIAKKGGDFQDLSFDPQANVIYGSCHCGDWIYQGGQQYSTPWETSSNIHRIRLIAAFDAQSGHLLPEFAPDLAGARGYGVWASFLDSTGVLWVGGDITRSRGANGTQATVGFARFTPQDVTAAAAPSNLQVTSDGTNDQLTWDSNTAGRTDYQVLRNDRVIATVTQGTSYSVAHTDDARYFVRSVDNVGNYSETTPVALAEVKAPPAEPTTPPAEESPVTPPDLPQPTKAPVSPPVEPGPGEDPLTPPDQPEPGQDPDQPADGADPVAPPIGEDTPADPEQPDVEDNPAPADPVEPIEPEKPADQKIIASGDDWRVAFHLFSDFDRSWRDTNYRYNTAWQWYTAPTSIGWGEGSLKTQLTFNFFTQPSSFFLRKEFTLNPAPNQELVLTTYADDGIAIYVNGKEVARQNLPANAYPRTAALARVSYADAKANPLTITIPSKDLKDGKNVIAVEVHSYRRGEPTTFDMDATLVTR